MGRDTVARTHEDVRTHEPDWDEVRELLTESYCAVAPAKLVALVDRPPDR